MTNLKDCVRGVYIKKQFGTEDGGNVMGKSRRYGEKTLTRVMWSLCVDQAFALQWHNSEIHPSHSKLPYCFILADDGERAPSSVQRQPRRHPRSLWERR